MKLFLRLFWLILTQSRRPRLGILDTSETPLRVLPNDLDIFMHVNNGVYLTYADLGRTDLMLRSGTFARVRKQGWYPVAAEASIRFRKSLTLGQRFNIHTRIAGWDDRAIYVEQNFMQGDTLMAQAFIDARFLVRGGGKVSVNELLSVLEIDVQPPEMPAAMQRWIDAKRRDNPTSVDETVTPLSRTG
ncbi:acyl-CoA thioesterase [Granulosicoccus sp. 3-233]|uniref:acyl-CoA thioesterase n=1 Tax=Granulosicoccus sp. 3-233 TaxID=3417969 RepID=UPI003D32D792